MGRTPYGRRCERLRLLPHRGGRGPCDEGLRGRHAVRLPGHSPHCPRPHPGHPETARRRIGRPGRGAHIFRAGHRLALAIRRSDLASDGANLVLNDGTAAFQTVPHVHLHVIPRRHGDKLSVAAGLLLRRPHDPRSTAAAIRAGISALDNDDETTAEHGRRWAGRQDEEGPQG